MRRRRQKGLTLIELIVAFTIMLILTAMAVPMARNKVRAEHERELRYAQREVRQAIDRYKDNCDQGYLGPHKMDANCYPETLEMLVEGVKLPGPDGKKMRFLRHIPRDPFTGKALCYRPEGEGFVLYSVGPDGTDDGHWDTHQEAGFRLEFMPALREVVDAG